jgi:hypothetical protein
VAGLGGGVASAAADRVGARRLLPGPLLGLVSGKPLWEPYTQAPCPATDQVRERAHDELLAVHERLGQSEVAQQVCNHRCNRRVTARVTTTSLRCGAAGVRAAPVCLT